MRRNFSGAFLPQDLRQWRVATVAAGSARNRCLSARRGARRRDGLSARRRWRDLGIEWHAEKALLTFTVGREGCKRRSRRARSCMSLWSTSTSACRWSASMPTPGAFGAEYSAWCASPGAATCSRPWREREGAKHSTRAEAGGTSQEHAHIVNFSGFMPQCYPAGLWNSCVELRRSSMLLGRVSSTLIRGFNLNHSLKMA